MNTILYIIWSLVPLILFLMALWSYLEKVAGKKKQERPGDLLKQALFCLICVLVSIVIDQYFLPSIKESIFTEFIPFAAYQVILFPVVLFIAAKIAGPTKDIIITKAPDASKVYKGKR